ncbi:hypothetical protein V8E53_013508 [Lactarius tabidus]
MHKSHPLLSVNAWQGGRHGVHSVADVDIARDSPMSPESEDSFSIAAGDSPGSHHSFSINMMPLAEGPDDLVMDVPPLPEDQDINMEADISSENKSSSPQSQYSFGINSMPLPELEDDNVLLAVHTSGAQHEGLELPLSQITVTLGAPLLLRTKHGRNFDNLLAIAGHLGADLTLPTKAEGVTDNCLTAPTWIWGECAPSGSGTEMWDGKENTVDLVHCIT